MTVVERPIHRRTVEKWIEDFEKRCPSKPFFRVAGLGSVPEEILINHPHYKFYNHWIALASKNKYGKHESIFILSKREFELLKITCTTPLSNEEVAVLWGRSEFTVKNELRLLYKKFGLQRQNINDPLRRTVLIARVAELGLVSYGPNIKQDSFSKFAKEK